jgi:hypothetical protein
MRKLLDITDECYSDRLSDQIYMLYIRTFYITYMTHDQNILAARKDTIKTDQDLNDAIEEVDSWYPHTIEDGVLVYDVSKYKKGWNRKF